ncbi:odorant receptor 22a [Leptinotarsa decemlineata]|uniref:odorant receptor 22a n=1 Tax=Leptinotarsa decemlineata TaxID=7539 RepID=UPI000C25517C|nr:odorant receptor 4-like [Leptinotarsa decemlineata]
MYFSTIHNSLKILRLCGSDPREGYGKVQCILFSLNIMCSLSMVVLLILKFYNMQKTVTVSDVTDAVTCLFLFSHGTLKLSAMFFKKKNTRELLTKMLENFWNSDDFKQSSIQKEVSEVHKSIKYTNNFIFGLHFFNAVGFLTGPLLTTDPILPFDCFRPQWAGYYGLLIYEDITAIISILFPILSVDLFFMGLMRLTQIQWKLLNHELYHTFDHIHMKDDSVQEKIKLKIKKCVCHHEFLIRYVEKINDTFSTSLFFYMVIIVLSMCVEMYNATTFSDPQIIRRAFVYTTAGCTAFMICFCYPCQDMIDEATKISSSIYFSNWYKYPEHSKSTQMILLRGQKTMNIRAGGFLEMDLRTGLATLKTMVSYSMFLRTISSMEN